VTVLREGDLAQQPPARGRNRAKGNEMTQDDVVVGEGRLTWAGSERRSDRYGAVVLMHDGDSLIRSSGYVQPDRSLAGRRGSLVAEVLEVRGSTHIGDLFRGLSPSIPEVGERITLGAGTAFVEKAWDDVEAIGLRPDDGRGEDWLDPKALYRAHEQTVRLIFEPQA
jgi:hypothetical protein